MTNATHGSKALAVGLTVLLAACASAPEPAPSSPRRAGVKPRDENETAIARATRALESGDVASARRDLEAHLEDEPDDAQARYILARALAAQGELRGARNECERALTLDGGKSALTWSLLAGLNEQMGDHDLALEAYARVHQLVPESLDPLHGMARCLIFLGSAEEALSALATARERPLKDPWTEYLAFQATRRLGRADQAEGLARAFLELVANRSREERAIHADNELEVRRWLEQRSEPLDAEVRRILVDAVRTACRLRMPGTVDAENEVLAEGPPRLFAFDERPVFVTIYPANGARALRGRGRGKSLVAALKGAIQAVQERPGYSPIVVKDAAVQVEVGHTLEPVAIRAGSHGELETDPPLVRGLHGIALRIDRQEAYCLPTEPLTHALPDVTALLSHATTSAGLAPDAWQGAPAAFRFETDAWLSPGPGLAIVRLEQGEPSPLPQGLPGEIREAALTGARWLTTQLRPAPEGADAASVAGGTLLAAAHDPTAQRIDDESASPADAARVALACAEAHQSGLRSGGGGAGDPVLLSAAEHLLGRLLPMLPPRQGLTPAEQDPEAQTTLEAATLEALGRVAAARTGAAQKPNASDDDVRAALVQELHEGATPTSRAEVVLALACELRARGGADPVLRRALDDLAPGLRGAQPRQSDTLVVQALVALEEALPGQGAGDQALAWGIALLDMPASGSGRGALERARHLRAVARVARLAARRGHPEAERLRARALEEARAVLALQLGARHRHFVRNAGLSLGGFRAEPTQALLRPVVTAECVLALLACVDLLQG